MANTFKLKQSAVSAKIPTTAQLQLGELAVNTYDGRLFTKKNVSGTESIIEFVSNSGTWGISITGNAATATTLQNARTINGASFNGSADITTASWGTTRTLTIGNTGKSVDGSAAVSWSLAEIGALPLTGGTLNGILYVGGTSVSANEGGEIRLTKATGSTLAGDIIIDNYLQQLRIVENGSPWRGAVLDFTGCGSQSTLLHSSNYSTYALPLAGGTLTGSLTAPRFISNVAQGTAPLGVTSTTVCTNLNADLLDGYHVGSSGGTIPLLNAANTWSAAQTYQCDIVVTGGSVSTAGPVSASRFIRDQGAPATQNTAATLTSAQVGAGILQTTPTAPITLTLPTGTTMEEIVIGTGEAYDLSIINTSANAVTIAGNTGHTLVGSATVAANTSSLWCIRKTAANTFISYRVA